MSKTVERNWELVPVTEEIPIADGFYSVMRLDADGNDIRHKTFRARFDTGQFWSDPTPTHWFKPVTTPSRDVAGSDAVAFAEWKEGRYEHYDTITSEGKSWLTWVTPENALVWTKETPEFTTAQLYAKFLEEHPQPAGASVDYKGLEQLEQAAVKYANENHPHDTPRSVASLNAFYAGAAFQTAQGHGNRPTGPAVEVASEDELFRLIELNRDSAITLNKMIEDLSKHVAPGVPDVRELVEALEKIVKHHDFATEESTGMSRHLAQIAQTALAGIKRK